MMKFADMFQMSLMNLLKRKTRTFLTVLGVLIGVTSIVVMISLGLGLSRAILEQVQNSASLTAITVTSSSDSDGDGKSTQYLDDTSIEAIEQLPNVTYAAPVLQVSIIAKYGAYSDYLNIVGTSLEALQDMDIEIQQGTLPLEGTNELSFFYGNQVLGDFSTKSGQSYWMTGALPDIDLMHDSILYILDTSAYYSSQNSNSTTETESSTTTSSQTSQKAPKKYLIPVCGVAAGGMDDYYDYSNNVYCDINQLIPVLKKEFKNSVIPGQPTTKSGKAYKTVYYSSLKVKVDKMENVSVVDQKIKDLGYDTYNNAEWIQSQKQQMKIIQAILGGIGAVALLVAAIGITNTMMMSIYERTKEIGIMKVLGCDMHDIQTMFLMEAGLIGFFGGVAGVVLSCMLSIGINIVAGKANLSVSKISYIPIWLVCISILFAIIVGMIAGYFPSRRAMKLSALAAIHNE